LGKKLSKVKSLLARIQFIDLANAIAVPAHKRKDHLRAYLSRAMVEARMPSYEHFRRAIPDIYAVELPLDLSPPLTLDEIHRQLKSGCHPSDLARNMEVADLLFGLVRNRGYRCYHHPAHDLPLGPSRKAQIRINHFVVDGDRGVFQYVYPRREELVGTQLQVMLSLVHHNYVDGDFVDSDVEIIDLSCPSVFGPRGGRQTSGVRNPRIIKMVPSDLISRKDLQPEVQSVHDLLLEIGNEPDTPA
jgi:hypothetical protein